MVDGAGYYVTGSEVAPLRVVFVHKGLPVGSQQNPPFAPHCLTNQESVGARHGQGGGMELDVFGVGDASAGPVCHRQAITAGSGGIGGVAIDAPDSAGGEDGFAGDDAVHHFGGAVKDVGAVTGDRLVGVERVGGVVGVGNQVDGGGIGHQLDVGLSAHGGGEGFDDTAPGAIADMQNPPARMGRFLAEG